MIYLYLNPLPNSYFSSSSKFLSFGGKGCQAVAYETWPSAGIVGVGRANVWWIVVKCIIFVRGVAPSHVKNWCKIAISQRQMEMSRCKIAILKDQLQPFRTKWGSNLKKLV